MRLSINHVTSYRYDVAPSYGLLQVRMVPQSSVAQRIIDWDLSFKGAEPQANFLDQHGNRVDLIEVLPDAEQVELHVNGTVETLSDDGVMGRHFFANAALVLSAPNSSNTGPRSGSGDD